MRLREILFERANIAAVASAPTVFVTPSGCVPPGGIAGCRRFRLTPRKFLVEFGGGEIYTVTFSRCKKVLEPNSCASALVFVVIYDVLNSVGVCLIFSLRALY